MTKNEERDQTQPDAPSPDDRRGAVKPTDRSVPSNPPVDEEALRKGEETLERVKPY